MVRALPLVVEAPVGGLPTTALPPAPASAPHSPTPAPAARRVSRLPAWLEITKPRLIPLLLATTLAGMAVSDAWPLPWPRLVACLLGGTFSSAAAGILNCLWEEELDRRMHRTSGRALPAGRLTSRQALVLAVALTVSAVLLLTLWVNALAAALALLGLCSYVLLYTALLPSEHRHRWRRRRHSSLGGGCRSHRPPWLGGLVALLPGGSLDPSPLLGPGPAAPRRLPLRRHPDAARGAGAPGDGRGH